MRERNSVGTVIADRPVNWGDSQAINGNDLKQVLRFTATESKMFSLLMECESLIVPAQLIGTADFRPMCRVQWGTGSITLQADFDCTYRRSIPFATSVLDVQAWVCPLPFPGTNVPIGPGLLNGANTRPGVASPLITAKMRVSVADGQALDEFPSVWLTQFEAPAGQFVHGKCRVLSCRTWYYANQDEGSPPLYLLLCDVDRVPVNGDIPFDGTALTLNIKQEIPMQSSRGYENGFAWALSTTSNVVSLPGAGAEAFITAEIRT